MIFKYFTGTREIDFIHQFVFLSLQTGNGSLELVLELFFNLSSLIMILSESFDCLKL